MVYYYEIMNNSLTDEVENKHLILCKHNHSFKGVLKTNVNDFEKSCKYILDAYHRKNKYVCINIYLRQFSNRVENDVCLYSQNNLICKCFMLILFIKYSVKIITFDSLNIHFTRTNLLDNDDVIDGCIYIHPDTIPFYFL